MHTIATLGSFFSRLLIASVILISALSRGAEPTPLPPDLIAYFRAQTERLESACLAEVTSLATWEQKRAAYKGQLLDMLGLSPLPARGDLKPVITGRIESADCVVEKLHFQSSPGLYVTANLYLPKDIPKPVPAILYVCGHALVKTNGVSYGNKTAYQHHGIWFARHGYVCLIIDTIQLGEIEGLHHGTYREGMWWWNARGYSPAGVEAWNSIRALDYLETRPEVDRQRIGMTGRSGGGSYTWTTAAIDDRIKVAAPVAGITDLRNQVVDGCVEGHCDCMFFVNTFRWDFPLNAALIAPRPLLIVNTDADSIFPLDGVVRTHEKARRIYRLQGKGELLGLVIGPGPHKDTQDLQVPVMRWFNRHLKGEDSAVEDSAQKLFSPQELRVFNVLPSDQVNTRIHERFVALANSLSSSDVLDRLRARCFSGWPEAGQAPVSRLGNRYADRYLRLSAYEFESQPGVHLSYWIAEPSGGSKPVRTIVHVLATNEWENWWSTTGRLSAAKPGHLDASLAKQRDLLRDKLRDARVRLAWIAPRGVGPSPWVLDAKNEVQMRRRFMLLGQTLEGMRVWDIRCGLEAIQSQSRVGQVPVTLTGQGAMGVNVLYASFFGEAPRELRLSKLPSSHREGPDYLNVLQVWDIRDALEYARTRSAVRVD